MTDKEIILDALNVLAHKNGHFNIKEHWTELDEETQVRIKIKLEDNGLATPHIYDAWKLMITTLGLKIKPDQLKEDGNLRKKYIDKEYKKGIVTTLIGVFVGFCLSAGLEVIKVNWLTPSQPEKIILPPIQIVRDTVYIHQDTIIKPINPK